jgi:hypothetical protein
MVLHEAKWPGVAVAVGAGSAFVRPEAALLVLLLLARSVGARRWSVLRLGIVALLVAVPPALAIYLYYGSVVPQPVVAKARFVNSSFQQLVHTFVVPDPFSAVLLPLAILGGIRAVRTGGVLANVALWSALYASSYLVARPVVYSWYAAPLQFAVIVLASFGVSELGGRSSEYVRRLATPLTVGVAGTIAVFAFWGTMLVVLGPSPVTRFVLKPLSEYGPAHLSPASTIVATDIGAIGYYSNAHVLDTHGLVWPPALEFREWPDIVRVYSADYLFMYATREVVTVLRDNPLLRAYRPIARFSKEGSTDLTLDPERYPAVSWTQDYILLERQPAR